MSNPWENLEEEDLSFLGEYDLKSRNNLWIKIGDLKKELEELKTTPDSTNTGNTFKDAGRILLIRNPLNPSDEFVKQKQAKQDRIQGLEKQIKAAQKIYDNLKD